MWWWQNFTQINEKKTTLSNGGGCCCYKRDGNVVARHPLSLLLLLLHSYCYTHVPFYFCKHNGDVDMCDNNFPFLFLLLHPSAFLLPLLVLCYWYYMKCGHVELHTNKQKEKPKSFPKVMEAFVVVANEMVMLLHVTMSSPSSWYYYYIVVATPSCRHLPATTTLLLHEMWWWLHSTTKDVTMA